MGLLGKFKELKMKDGVEGSLKVVGITTPDPTSTECNYRLDGVVSADGVEATAIVHHGMTSVGHWPSPGDVLPVTVDRAKPDHIVIHWGKVPKGIDQARSAAQQLAEQMRAGGSGDIPMPQSSGASGSSITLTVNGVQVPIPTGGGTIELPDPDPEPAVAEGMAAIPTVSNADILARGSAGSATLLGSFATDVPCTKPGHTNVGLMLNVMIDGHPPFQAENLYATPDAKLAALTVGKLLPVRADLATTGLVAVDWEKVK